MMNFTNRPSIFGQDCSRAFLSDKSFGMHKVIRVSSIHVA